MSKAKKQSNKKGPKVLDPEANKILHKETESNRKQHKRKRQIEQFKSAQK